MTSKGSSSLIATMNSPSSSALMTPEALGEIVTLYVGAKRKKFLVHKKILCKQSKFFDAGFNKGFKETTEGEMYLPQDDPAVVANLIEYLYRGQLPNPLMEQQLFELYFLAEKICLPSLMDRIMDTFLEHRNFIIRFEVGRKSIIEIIYANTHHNSKLRLCITAAIAFTLHSKEGNEKWLQDYLALWETCPHVFKDTFTILATHGTAAFESTAFESKAQRIQRIKEAFGDTGTTENMSIDFTDLTDLELGGNTNRRSAFPTHFQMEDSFLSAHKL
ncbi:hypothetical protein SBOR_9943 [Sclerotinia borealis F-4128]|uniref:BTB domain-containing protein n=1 Tax=Sclerotinia borealis (strain F-4128) TaxID=1432307 RepID=W9C510_SCLBF|nr:hypothetical protein SBOR_9943 [Sclerotinia borealis F-4128]